MDTVAISSAALSIVVPISTIYQTYLTKKQNNLLSNDFKNPEPKIAKSSVKVIESLPTKPPKSLSLIKGEMQYPRKTVPGYFGSVDKYSDLENIKTMCDKGDAYYVKELNMSYVYNGNNFLLLSTPINYGEPIGEIKRFNDVDTSTLTRINQKTLMLTK